MGEGQRDSRLGSGLTYAEAMNDGLASVLPALAEASRTVGSPQIRNRGTVGGNLGTASPAGDALPPLLVYEAEVVVASAERGVRVVPVARFLTGPKQNALLPDELIVAVRVEPREMRQTFMKVGPRNAMVIAVVSLCLAVDREADEIRVCTGRRARSQGSSELARERVELAELVARDASPIDDVRGTAAYRAHALRCSPAAR